MYQRTELQSGIRIISEQIPTAKSVTLGVWFEVGSRDEGSDQQGFAHFIEHLLFKGSKRYNAQDIAWKIDAVGGQINAFTTKEKTCYYARVLDQDLPLITDIFHEMLLNPEFVSSEIDRERKVIIEEIKMSEDLPEDHIHDCFSYTLWGEHSLGRNSLGTEQSIVEASRKNLVDFYQSNYTTDRLVIVATGNVDHHYLVNSFAKPFENLRKIAPKKALLASPITGKFIKIPRETGQVHLCFGGSGLARRDKREYALQLLDIITGGGMSSRLFQELREQRGLVYSTYSDHVSYRLEGEFLVYAGCSQKHYDEVIELIKAELARLKDIPLSTDEFRRAQGQLKGNLVLALESMGNRMDYLAQTELNQKKLLTIEEIISEIELTQPEDVQHLAKELFQVDRWNLVTIGLA